ncbi:hypothetical protein [Nocardia terpenica]|uniref:AAA family ATPase n=1 Tax=Nocardia terpenica TaxID=455432 RepID=A0A164P126_9NOCA|nr:hypothetical protein [Nocardia terpenica]KZM74977.1 hypothetical protein AWN90_23520 [Nocardia terpenica]NQE93356.1 hypothetical protein [Nocardia terpenica]
MIEHECRRLLIVTGQEGAGKTTVVRALREHLSCGAVLDAEDIGQVTPWTMDDAFREMFHRNVAAVVTNFWAAGYPNVVAGSFVSGYDDFLAFRRLLSEAVTFGVVQLLASKPTRDRRRIARMKPSSAEWRDHVDRVDPEDVTLRRHGDEYRFLAVMTDGQPLSETLGTITAAFPEVFTH